MRIGTTRIASLLPVWTLAVLVSLGGTFLGQAYGSAPLKGGEKVVRVYSLF